MVLAIYCAGGLGREILDFASYLNRSCNRWDKFIFVDDITPEHEVRDIPVYRYEAVKTQYAKDCLDWVIASGEPFGRKNLYEKLVLDGNSPTNLIDPQCSLAPDIRLGNGIIIMGRVSIASGSRIQNNVFLDTTLIGHDVSIGENGVFSVNSFVGGGTEVGDNVFAGPGCLIKDRVHIGEGSILAIGSVIQRNVKPYKIVGGNPARVLGNNELHQVFGLFK